MVVQMVILMVVAMVLEMVLLMGSEVYYVNITIFELGLYHCFDNTSFKQVLTGVTAETYF